MRRTLSCAVVCTGACINVSTVLSNECCLPKHRKRDPMSLHASAPTTILKAMHLGEVVKTGVSTKSARNARKRQGALHNMASNFKPFQSQHLSFGHNLVTYTHTHAHTRTLSYTVCIISASAELCNVFWHLSCCLSQFCPFHS